MNPPPVRTMTDEQLRAALEYYESRASLTEKQTDRLIEIRGEISRRFEDGNIETARPSYRWDEQ